MAPPCERLEALDAAGGHIDPRLVMDFDLTQVDCSSEVVFEEDPPPARRVELGHEELIGAAAPFLRAIHGQIGVFEQPFKVLRIVRKERDTDAWRAVKIAVTDGEGSLERVYDSLRDEGRGARIGKVSQRERELIAALTGADVDIANATPDSHRDPLEQLVAGVVAQGIVHGFEAIEIDEEHRQHQGAPPCFGQHALNPFAKVRAIRQAGKLVVLCEMAQLVIRPAGFFE